MSRASDRAYSQIRRMILSGQLVPGQQIREEQLAEACGVSRTPVRDALRRLEAESLVSRNESQRSFVAEWSLEDIAEAFQLRALLEGRAAKRAATRITVEQMRVLKACNRRIETAIGGDKPGIGVFLENNRIFHATIMEAAASVRLTNILASIVEQPVVLRTAQQYDRENLMRSHGEHQELVAAFERRDGDWAESVMAAHIYRAFHAYADLHQRELTDASGVAAA
jgi:DNA-binding GntR family transcriptional regulator